MDFTLPVFKVKTYIILSKIKSTQKKSKNNG